MTAHEHAAATADRSERHEHATVPWTPVTVFIIVSFGLAWLVTLPLYLQDSQESGYASLFSILTVAMMFTPALGTLVVVFLLRTPRVGRMRFLGIWPLRPAKRVVSFTAAMLLLPALLVAAGLAMAAGFGWLHLDLQNFSGYQQLIEWQGGELGSAASAMPPAEVLALIQIVSIPLIGLINVLTLAILGEEIAWRGWLLPALRPLGIWPALLLSGMLWGLWHAPIILLGYNFDRTDVWGVLLMTVGCVIWGILFGWLRLRTGSLWPAVVAHGVFNAAGSTLLVTLPAADHSPNMALVNPLGVSGWIVAGLVVLVLLVVGQFAREPDLAAKRAKPAQGQSPAQVTPSGGE